MRRALLVAFHFPPLSGSSGIQRTLRFARHLPDFGWQPIVLTVSPRAYETTDLEQVADVPESIEVIRAPAWDASRHFALVGRYPAFLERPDRWISWWPGAVWAGLRAIRRSAIDAIWSTYPIATAHLVGCTLATRSGLPWIADFRDPMAQVDYPKDPKTWRQFERIERRTFATARFMTCTAPGAVSEYRNRYPDRADDIRLLENGYDEASFSGLEGKATLNPGRLTLLHSGLVYPDERDPSALFAALAAVRRTSPGRFERLMFRFRAPVHGERVMALAREFGVADSVQVMPHLGYREALEEMLSADGLLVLQDNSCNAQIPAKLYEYLRAARPVLVLTDLAGDTAAMTRAAGLDTVAGFDDTGSIRALLERFCDDPPRLPLPDPGFVESASRRERTRDLARLLDLAMQPRGGL